MFGHTVIVSIKFTWAFTQKIAGLTQEKIIFDIGLPLSQNLATLDPGLGSKRLKLKP